MNRYRIYIVTGIYNLLLYLETTEVDGSKFLYNDPDYSYGDNDDPDYSYDHIIIMMILIIFRVLPLTDYL